MDRSIPTELGLIAVLVLTLTGSGLVASTAAAKSRPATVSASATETYQMARDIRSLGHRIQGDLRRTLTDYRQLPSYLAGIRKGGLTARQRSVERAHTAAVGPHWDLVDINRSVNTIKRLTLRLAALHSQIPGTAKASQAISADTASLNALSVEVGDGAAGLNAMARFGRLLEDNRTTLLTGRKPPAPALRGMASALQQATAALAPLRTTKDPFIGAERAYLKLGIQGLAQLRAGHLGPIGAMSLYMRARRMRAHLIGALPGFQIRVADRMAAVAAAASSQAVAIEHGHVTRLSAATAKRRSGN